MRKGVWKSRSAGHLLHRCARDGRTPKRPSDESRPPNNHHPLAIIFRLASGARLFCSDVVTTALLPRTFSCFVSFVLALMCRLVAWGAEEEPAPVEAIDHAGIIRSWNAESLARGEKLYSRICLTCHGPDRCPARVRSGRSRSRTAAIPSAFTKR